MRKTHFVHVHSLKILNPKLFLITSLACWTLELLASKLIPFSNAIKNSWASFKNKFFPSKCTFTSHIKTEAFAKEIQIFKVVAQKVSITKRPRIIPKNLRRKSVLLKEAYKTYGIFDADGSTIITHYKQFIENSSSITHKNEFTLLRALFSILFKNCIGHTSSKTHTCAFNCTASVSKMLLHFMKPHIQTTTEVLKTDLLCTFCKQFGAISHERI